MKLPKITELVGNSAKAEFVRYEDRKLWYVVCYDVTHPRFGDGMSVFQFPVPIEDTDGATFLATDKALFFMRWIRKHLAFLQESYDERARTLDELTRLTEEAGGYDELKGGES